MSVRDPSEDLPSKPEVSNQSGIVDFLIRTTVGSRPLRRSSWGSDGSGKGKSMRRYVGARREATTEVASGKSEVLRQQ